MAQVELPQVSLVKGEISPSAADRTDAQFYPSALQTCQNFFIQAEGAGANRPGLQFIGNSLTNTPNGSYLVPFVYNNQVSYVVEVSAGGFHFFSNGALVPVSTLTNPYQLTDLPNLRWAQSANTLSLVVNTWPMYQLQRTTPSAFTYTAPTLLFGPFQDLNTDGVTYVYASGTSGTVTITASSPLFQAQHVGALFTIQEQFMNSVTAWEAQKIITYPTGSSPVGMFIRSDGKIYKCVASLTSSDHTATGTFQPVHTFGTQQDGDGLPVPNFVNVCGVSWQFVSTNAGVAQITKYISPTQVQAVVQNHKGIYSNFPPTVVGGPQTVSGTASTFSGNGTAVTFTLTSSVSTGDPNQFYVTIGGVFQDPSTYQVTYANPGGTITFYTPPVSGTNNITVAQVTGTLNNIYSNSSQANLVPMTGLCLSTYWAFGSINAVQGYASDICYYNDRLMLAGTQLQPQTFFGSVVSDYLNYGVSNPQVDSDSITETINARQQNPINNLLPMNNLLMGTASTSWRVTDSSGIGAITPSNISVIPQEFFGMQPVPALQTGTTIIYVQWGGRKLRDIIYNFYNDKFQGQELTIYARHIFPYGTTATRIAFAPEPYGLVYCVRSDGVMCVCTYLPEQQVLAWSRYVTQGNFEDVTVVPENGSFAVYTLVGRTVNGVYTRYVERFAPREYATINDAFFVDSGLTYDGRNTSTTTMTVTGGTTWLPNDVGTLTASSSAGWAGFTASNATNGDGIWLNNANGNRLCRLQITAVASGTSASVQFLDPVPATLQGVPDKNWTFAKVQFSGLTNLPGQTVSIFADGQVLTQQTVNASGVVTLTAPGGVVHVGLPYTCQLQSLNFNLQGQEVLRNKQKTIPTASVVVDQSYPFYIGPDFVNMVPIAQRQFESYGSAISPHTGILHAQLETEPSDDAALCLQMSDPAPLRVLGWVAVVDVGEPG